MPDPDPLEGHEEEAALDSAVERELQHELERAAEQKQGLIEKATREHQLDEG